MTRKVRIGVDVGKHYLDWVLVMDQASWPEISKGVVNRCLNKSCAIASWLLDCLTRYDGLELEVAFEATGTYSDKLEEALLSKGITCYRVNTRACSDLSKSLQITHQNDHQSARILLFMAIHMGLEPYKPVYSSSKRRKQILSAIEGFHKQARVLSNKLEAQAQYASPFKAVVQSLTLVLEEVDKQIQILEKQLSQLKDKVYQADKELAMTVVGIGVKTADWLLTLTQGISQFDSAKQLVKYCGLVGRVHQSGTSVYQKKGITKQASAKLRACLFMGAKSAIRHNKACKELYLRLRAKGKSYYKAMGAVMAKLIKQVYAVVTSKTPFENDYYLKWK